MQSKIYEELKYRMLLFLALPAVILFVSIILLMYDWVGLTKFVITKMKNSTVARLSHTSHTEQYATLNC